MTCWVKGVHAYHHFEASGVGGWQWGEDVGFASDNVILFVSSDGNTVVASDIPPKMDLRTLFTVYHAGRSRCILATDDCRETLWRFNPDNGLLEVVGELYGRKKFDQGFLCEVVTQNDDVVVFSFEGGIFAFELSGALRWRRRHPYLISLPTRLLDDRIEYFDFNAEKTWWCSTLTGQITEC